MPLKTAVPVLSIAEPERSLSFYTETLGFELDWTWREPDGTTFQQISADGVRVYLKQTGLAPSPGCLYLYVDDVDRWYQRLLEKNRPVDALPSARPWGNREMVLSDPDGNKIHICTPLV